MAFVNVLGDPPELSRLRLGVHIVIILALLLGPLERPEVPPALHVGFTSFPPGDFQEDQATIWVPGPGHPPPCAVPVSFAQLPGSLGAWPMLANSEGPFGGLSESQPPGASTSELPD